MSANCELYSFLGNPRPGSAPAVRKFTLAVGSRRSFIGDAEGAKHRAAERLVCRGVRRLSWPSPTVLAVAARRWNRSASERA